MSGKNMSGTDLFNKDLTVTDLPATGLLKINMSGTTMPEKKNSRRLRMPAAAACFILLLLFSAGCGLFNRKTADPAGKQAGGGPASESAGAEGEAAGKLEAVFFDVGKGDCILFTAGEVHVLLDTGYEETADSIIDELQDRDISSLDAMIITHYDKDHVGGAALIAGEIPTGIIYLPDYTGEEDKCGDLLDLIEEEKLQSVRVSSRQEIKLGRASMSIDPALVPYDEEKKNDNDASLLISIIDGEDSWFLPGDIEEEALDHWLSGTVREYDILKLPHHGKKEKNSKELIDAVSPVIAVITDGEERPASEKLIKRLKKNGADVYSTYENGTITVSGNGSGKYSVSVENP